MTASSESLTRVTVRRGGRTLHEIVEEPIWSADSPAPVDKGLGYSAQLRAHR